MCAPLQRSAFWWIRSIDAASQKTEGSVQKSASEIAPKPHATIRVEEVTKKHGVPPEVLLEYLSSEIEAIESCRSLPFTLLLVVSYAAMIISHEHAPAVRAVEDSLTHDITENANFGFSSGSMGHKNMMDVDSHADFWSWMSCGFVPLVFQQATSWSETRNVSEPYIQAMSEVIKREDRGVMLSYNRIVLGVRMSQERPEEDGSGPAKCVGSADILKVYGKECVGGFGYELEPEMFDARRTVNPTRRQWLYIDEDVEDVKKILMDMERTSWLDERTKKVEVAFPVYNGEFGLHTLIMCDFFFSRGGKVWKNIIPLTTYADWYQNWYNWAIDATWFSCILWIGVSEGVEISRIVKLEGVRGLRTSYVNFWNIIDWISVIAGLGIIAMFLISYRNTDTLNIALEELSAVDVVGDRETYIQKALAYWAALEVQVHYLYYYRMLLSMNPSVIAMRLFKAFNAQPRLAAVTKTLQVCIVDILHFMLILGSVFIIYAVAGVILFGRSTTSFTTIFRSMNTCFRIMQGDFDWEELRQVGRMDAMLWFLPFHVLIVMILLNMLIAIMMETYADVKTSLADANSLFDEGVKVWQALIASTRNRVVPLPKLRRAVIKWLTEARLDAFARFPSDLDALDDLEPGPAAVEGQLDRSELITVHTLKAIVPEMRRSQRMDVLEKAIMRHYTKSKKSASMDEVEGLVKAIDARTHELKVIERGRLRAAGKAHHNLAEMTSLQQHCRAEMAAAREDLAGWLPEDPDYVPLPEWVMRFRANQSATSTAQPGKGPSGASVKPVPPNSSGTGGDGVTTTGGSSSSTAGVRPRLGKDESCVGEEGSTTVSDKSGGTPKGSWERRLEALQQELRLGRETVEEALLAVNELHQRLLRSKGDRRRGVESFRQLRQRATALHRENRAQRERLKQGQVKLKVATSARDEYFERVKALFEENRQLESELRQAQQNAGTAARRGAGSAGRGVSSWLRSSRGHDRSESAGGDKGQDRVRSRALQDRDRYDGHGREVQGREPDSGAPYERGGDGAGYSRGLREQYREPRDRSREDRDAQRNRSDREPSRSREWERERERHREPRSREAYDREATRDREASWERKASKGHEASRSHDRRDRDRRTREPNAR